MYCIRCSNAPSWYARLDSHLLRWSNEPQRARLFDSVEQAEGWLRRRGHSGMGLSVARHGSTH